MDRLQIGTITKPQALKGEFRVKPSISNLKEYKKIKSVYIGNAEYLVSKVTLRDTFVIFKVESIDTCEQAEMLRNKPIFADVEKENSVISYIGYDVIVDNNSIGQVSDISNYGSKDILTINGSNNIMLPLIDGLVVSENNENKTITLSKEIFEQVAVYEN